MEDYFDRVQTQLGALTKDGAHLGARGGRGRWRQRRRAAIPVLASALVVAVVAALLVATHPARHPTVSGGVGTRRGPALTGSSAARGDPGPVIPATYGPAACANAAGACNPLTRIPVVMHRGMQFGLIKVGRQCRATPLTRIYNSYVGGPAVGAATEPVRLVIANHVNARRRTIELGRPLTPGWGAVKVVWVAAHAYRGPFVIRAQPLLRSGPIRIGEGGGAGGPPLAGPLVVAAGPTINAGGGLRTLPSSIWARRPGCYGVQVDGLNFTSDFVLHLVAARPLR